MDETDAADAPDWTPVTEVLEELGMTLDEFRAADPHVGLDHSGFAGEVVVDRNLL